MPAPVLNPAEQRIEEIRVIRKRLFGTVGTDYTKLKELGSHCPEGFRLLRGVKPITPLSERIREAQSDRKLP